MLSDFLAAMIVGLVCIAVSLPIAGCLSDPTFVDRCQHCGEYLDDAEAAHAHLARCSPCR